MSCIKNSLTWVYFLGHEIEHHSKDSMEQREISVRMALRSLKKYDGQCSMRETCICFPGR